MGEISVASRAEFDGLLKGVFVYTDQEAALDLVQQHCTVAPIFLHSAGIFRLCGTRNFIAIAWG